MHPHLISDRYRRAAKVMFHALVLDDSSGWGDAAAVWAARLSEGERAAVALAALQSLPEEAVANITSHVHGAGYPPPSFIDPLAQAQLWATAASGAELDAYLLAAFLALPKQRQQSFLNYAERVSR